MDETTLIVVRRLSFLNALYPIVVIPFLSITLLRFGHSATAKSPIDIRVYGVVSLVIAVLYKA